MGGCWSHGTRRSPGLAPAPYVLACKAPEGGWGWAAITNLAFVAEVRSDTPQKAWSLNVVGDSFVEIHGMYFDIDKHAADPQKKDNAPNQSWLQHLPSGTVARNSCIHPLMRTGMDGRTCPGRAQWHGDVHDSKVPNVWTFGLGRLTESNAVMETPRTSARRGVHPHQKPKRGTRGQQSANTHTLFNKQ